MRLVPVVEVNSQYFQTRDYLEDAGGILEISPYLELDNYWLVEISKLNPEIVKILLDQESEMDYGTMTEYHLMMELDGGYILEVSNSVEILPQCCSDIGTHIPHFGKVASKKPNFASRQSVSYDR